MNKFKCAMCGGIFDKARSDEEAIAEMQENFPNMPEADMEFICGDCYKEVMG